MKTLKRNILMRHDRITGLSAAAFLVISALPLAAQSSEPASFRMLSGQNLTGEAGVAVGHVLQRGIGVSPTIHVPVERALTEALTRSGVGQDAAAALSAAVGPDLSRTRVASPAAE